MIRIDTNGFTAAMLIILGFIGTRALLSEKLGLMQVINENPIGVLLFVFIAIILLKNGK